MAIHCYNIKTFNRYFFVLNNKSELLPVVSGFIISRLRLGTDLVVHKDIVVHIPGVICHVHIGIGGIETIGLKYTKEFSYKLMVGFRGEKPLRFLIHFEINLLSSVIKTYMYD